VEKGILNPPQGRPTQRTGDVPSPSRRRIHTEVTQNPHRMAPKLLQNNPKVTAQ